MRFALELALLAGAAALAWRLTPSLWHWISAPFSVGVVALIWGLFVSPKRHYALVAPWPLVIEAALFLGVGAGLVTVGLTTPATVVIGVWLIDLIALALLKPGETATVGHVE